MEMEDLLSSRLINLTVSIEPSLLFLLVFGDAKQRLTYLFIAHIDFGGKSLFDQTGPLKTSVGYFDQKGISLRAIQPTECYCLSRESIVKVIGNINRLGKPSLPFSRKLIKGMKRNDLILHRILGAGMFGRVWLVQHKESSNVYAMKAMSKKDIIGKKMVKAVTREKNVMASIEHPFISNLVSTFQDQHTIYLLLDYVQGGELFGLVSAHLMLKYCLYYTTSHSTHLFFHHSRSIACQRKDISQTTRLLFTARVFVKHYIIFIRGTFAIEISSPKMC